MDDTTMKLGLLMEAAQANQKAATVVREEVHRVVREELHSLAADTKRASDALHAVRRAANVRALAWSVGMTILCSAIPLALACWIIPSRAQIAALRARRDALITQIANLEERGGRIDLRRCGDGARLCVRVDRKAPIYGEQSDYLIVRGY
jgi:hypothetical protein